MVRAVLVQQQPSPRALLGHVTPGGAGSGGRAAATFLHGAVPAGHAARPPGHPRRRWGRGGACWGCGLASRARWETRRFAAAPPAQAGQVSRAERSASGISVSFVGWRAGDSAFSSWCFSHVTLSKAGDGGQENEPFQELVT